MLEDKLHNLNFFLASYGVFNTYAFIGFYLGVDEPNYSIKKKLVIARDNFNLLFSDPLYQLIAVSLNYSVASAFFR